MAISAPFRFARINRWVFKPEWGPLVSHDVPFADGYSGVIEFTIKAETPLMVGGPRGIANNNVHPFQLPCGKYAIPSSSIQGMIRSVLEIATFGKLGPFVQDRRFAVRDISGKSKTAKQVYQERMVTGLGGSSDDPFKSKAKTGWLLKSKSGLVVIPCQMARIDSSNVRSVVQKNGITIRDNVLRRFANDAGDADERIKLIFGQTPDPSAFNVMVHINPIQSEDHTKQIDRDYNRKKWIEYQRCTDPPAASVSTKGTLVITGKASSGLGDGRKKHEFVFHTPCRSTTLTTSPACQLHLTEDVARDFFAIHDPDTGQNARPNPNWAFWKTYFLRGEPVPVFYLEEEGKVTAVGTAQMFKLAMKLSTHDLLKNSAIQHVSVKQDADLDAKWGDWDLPSLIFGATGGVEDSFFEKNLKRRAAFDLAVQTNEASLFQNFPAAALLSPKPSYYPIYVRQHRITNGVQTATHTVDRIPYIYATYNEMVEHAGPAEKFPELSGVKIWPAVGRIEQVANVPSVNTQLNPLNAGAEFKCAVRVTNLRKFELGALLWALTLGNPAGNENRMHKLGGGKPLGLGNVSIANIKPTLTANNFKEPDVNVEALIQLFVEKMSGFTALAQYGTEVDWANTPQVKALRKVSLNVAQNAGDYSYLTLSVGNGNGFQDEKAAGNFLPDFVRGPTSEFNKKPPPIRAVAQTWRAHPSVPALFQPQNYLNRLEPPAENAAWPEATTYSLGDIVRIIANNSLGRIVAFPELREHETRQGHLLWVVATLGAHAESPPNVAQYTQRRIEKSEP